jgi:SAM-dependent methyltransferase
MSDLMRTVKEQKWFYEFRLPDGSTTDSYLPPHVRAIHLTRERALRQFLALRDWSSSTALDVACHEGFYSLVLNDYFGSVTGLDKNAGSLNKARQIAELLGHSTIRFLNESVESHSESTADFVLCFGLLYHVENPVTVFRDLARLARSAICIETQVLPVDMETSIEDGNYTSQRSVQGLFGVCEDYSASKEGGLTDIALVPSRKAVEYCLRTIGFPRVQYFRPSPDDYEQFVRGHRVVLIAER